MKAYLSEIWHREMLGDGEVEIVVSHPLCALRSYHHHLLPLPHPS